MFKVTITRKVFDSMESANFYLMTDPKVIDEKNYFVIMDKESKQTIYINKDVLVSIQIQPQ